MDTTIAILNKVLPVPLLIALGFILGRRRVLTDATIGQLRTIVLLLALPAVLFLSFLDLELEPSYLLLVAFMFVLCLVLVLLGRVVRRVLRVESDYFPFLLTGFEYGMLGIGLFGTAFGIENIGPIAVTALGHEVFIWFLFLPLLLIKRDGRQNLAATAKSFITSPVILAILSSLLLNAVGARDRLYEWPITGAVLEAGRFLSYLTVPLVLIIIGHGIKFERRAVGAALGIVAYRLALLIPLALLACRYFVREWLGLPPVFEAALFSFLILPPPFITPLFVRKDLSTDEHAMINNTLTIHALVSILVYVVYFVVAGRAVV
jgi:hypothetical protein